MDPLQTQVFSPEVETAFRHLDLVMAGAIREITFASLAKGSVEPDVAQPAADRLVRRATRSFQLILDAEDEKEAAKTLSRVLAELVVSSTTIWVTAQHTAIESMRRDSERG